jgi:prepilin signal peptidase PulO-like enzyme (type II secretory pathway)
MFPVLSWVFLRGKCRYCKEKVSPRYALVETLCGLSYLSAFLVYFNKDIVFLNIQNVSDFVSPEFILALILFPVLICLSFFDIDTGEIEYWCPISISVLGIISVILSALGVLDGTFPNYLKEHLIGAVVISLPFAILAFLGMMGGGDVQLMAAAGLLLGWKIIPAALIGIILGAIYGIILKSVKKSKPLNPETSNTNSVLPETPNPETITPESLNPVSSETLTPETETPESLDQDSVPLLVFSGEQPPQGTVIRFGPFLALGIAVSYLFGELIINWYSSFL